MIISERLAMPSATEQAGARLAAGLAGGMVVTLTGALGAGKTTLVRGVLRKLGIRGAVKSPTYALVEAYESSNLYFYHFDFYRLDGVEAAEDAGFRDYFRDDSVCLIEWPERAEGLLPVVDVALSLSFDDGGRRLTAVAHTKAGRKCLTRFAANRGPS